MTSPGREPVVYVGGDDGFGTPLRRDTIMRIASISKPIVTAAALSMVDTAFHVPPDKLHRFVPQLAPGEDGLALFDPVDGMWASAPQFPLSSAGLVSTIDDLIAFTDRLRDGRLISTTSLSAMTTDHLTPQQRDDAGLFLDGAGWGYGLCVEPDGRYGWDGGLGTGWRVAGRSAHRRR